MSAPDDFVAIYLASRLEAAKMDNFTNKSGMLILTIGWLRFGRRKSRTQIPTKLGSFANFGKEGRKVDN